MRDVKASIRPGDRVLIKGNRFEPWHREESRVLEVGMFPSMWLKPGEKRWGAVVEYSTMYINPKFGEPGQPKEVPGKAESSPMLEDQFTWNETDQRWELQLI